MLNECNGCEYQCNLSHIDICTLGSPCPNQRSTPMTEQEYLQTCTTNQFADWLSKTFNVHPCGYLLDCNRCGLNNRCSEDSCPTSAEAWAEWLKQPHKGE